MGFLYDQRIRKDILFYHVALSYKDVIKNPIAVDQYALYKQYHFFKNISAMYIFRDSHKAFKD
jgi:hypothetical protein